MAGVVPAQTGVGLKLPAMERRAAGQVEERVVIHPIQGSAAIDGNAGATASQDAARAIQDDLVISPGGGAAQAEVARRPGNEGQIVVEGVGVAYPLPVSA